MPYMPTISIVTPSFNQADYLEECIESVLGQGYQGLQYVIMDGGSTDGSVEIIKKYEKHLTYWQLCSDGGQYKAVSEGFRRTSGEIMAWLNSDDKYHPLAFAKIASVFEDHPEVKWLTGRKSFWDASGNLTKIENDLAVFSRRKFLEGNFDKPYIQQESTFWRRSLWNQAGGHLADNVSLAGDLELWLRFFRYAPLHTVDTLLGGYRFHHGQRGVTNADAYFREGTALLLNEMHLSQTSLEELPAPPPHIRISRERLSTFLHSNDITLTHPNRTGCWCEYTEDCMAAANALLKEHRVDAADFWQNEISLFSLAKPRAAWLLGETLEALDQINSYVYKLLGTGRRFEAAGENAEALRCYREAFETAPTSPSVCECLLLCLWNIQDRGEALGLLPGILSSHSHNHAVVSAAFTILTGCGAREQARGVCDEFLMSNPHDTEIQMLRKSLES